MDPPWPLRDEDRWRLLEYRYMRVNPGLTHAQYEELPLDHILWTVNIHNEAEAIRIRAENKAAGG